MKINFTSIDLEKQEREAVVAVLNSGWLTTGKVTKGLERRMVEITGAKGAVCLNSATAAMELALRAAGIGSGDEVIVPAYTFSATAAAVLHTGAKVVMCDCPKGSFLIDAEMVRPLITPRTKCIIGVDIAGEMGDYDALKILAAEYSICSDNPIIKALGRPLVMADAAHSIGASRMGAKSGQAADISCFSFHATKNITTAEGGAVVWDIKGLDDEWMALNLGWLSLHGQTKTALDKLKGGYDYDIVFPGFKHNLTDICAAIALSQLDRLEEIIMKRRRVIEQYNVGLEGAVGYLPHSEGSCCHLYMAILPEDAVERRDAIIAKLFNKGISANVHYKPLPLLTAYKNLGYRQEDFPNAIALYRREISLPLSSVQSEEETAYVIDAFLEALRS